MTLVSVHGGGGGGGGGNLHDTKIWLHDICVSMVNKYKFYRKGLTDFLNKLPESQPDLTD